MSRDNISPTQNANHNTLAFICHKEQAHFIFEINPGRAAESPDLYSRKAAFLISATDRGQSDVKLRGGCFFFNALDLPKRPHALKYLENSPPFSLLTSLSERMW